MDYIDYSIYVDYITIAVKNMESYEKQIAALKVDLKVNIKLINQLTNLVEKIKEKVKLFRNLLFKHQITNNVDKTALKALVGDKYGDVIKGLDIAANFIVSKIGI
jgi:hypothetical protein